VHSYTLGNGSMYLFSIHSALKNELCAMCIVLLCISTYVGLLFCFNNVSRKLYLILLKQNIVSDATSEAKMQARTGYLQCLSDCASRSPFSPTVGLTCAATCAYSRKLEDTPAKMDIAIQNFKTCKFLLRYL
jgi:hypothetical protein